MKLSNLSLAILVAVGTAACGGSGSDNQTTDNNNNNNNPTPTPTPTPTPDQSALPQVVDPTATQVVDDKDLAKVESVGTLQYIRQDGSNYDRTNNPNQMASASPYLGVHLDDQNPKLTNIVLARQNLLKVTGEPVKAQFTGGINKEPLTAAGAPINITANKVEHNNLQVENWENVDVLAGQFGPNANTAAKHTADTVYKNRVFSDGAATPTERTRVDTLVAGTNALEVWNKQGGGSFKELEAGDFAAAATAPFDVLTKSVQGDDQYSLTKVSAVRVPVAPKRDFASKFGNASVYKTNVAYKAAVAGPPAQAEQKATLVIRAEDFGAAANKITPEIARRYGGHLVWWSSPDDAFENKATRTGKAATSADATTGLVRIGGGIETLGQETKWSSADNKFVDHHKTSTRIFGRYHLAFANQDKNGRVDPVTLNTFVGASSFIAELDTSGINTAALQTANDDAGKAIANGFTKAKNYSIGAVPGTLVNVQYGRVTTNLDLELDADTFGDGFMHQPYRVKGADDSVDNYFYRGTNATTVAEMAALPTDKKLTYHGHALMYGIDNNYHGGSGQSNLPNAFAPGGGNEGQLGLGNFVEATADLATKKLTGTVYNAWLLDQSKAAVTKDVLVNFSGDILGNSAFGSADRAYVAGDDKADFRASFFGDAAEEIGGSFNTVQSIPANGSEKFGSAYANGDWGGVFGAKQAGTGNTFQGDDGANVYTGLSN